MELDDTVRSRVGVVACVRPASSDKTRLVFDDVLSDDASSPKSWAPDRLFTWRDFDTKQLFNLQLTEKEFAQIGENLVMRLLALEGVLK